jgi:crossover junction endodeoxyribonuclease RuvC
MKILGIDPGIGRVGWGIIEDIGGKQRMIDVGCMETPSNHAPETRLEAIHDFFRKLITDYKPDQVSIEQLFFATNARTAFSVGQARGVIVLAVSECGVPMTSYTPLQVKLTVTGYGQADKKQIQMMVKSLLKLKEVPKPDDAADALAIALTHAFSYKLKEKVLKSV